LQQIWLSRQRFGHLLCPLLFVMMKVDQVSETSVSACNLDFLIDRDFGAFIHVRS